MPRFEVFAQSTAIGYSELAGGDAPMGVAVGRFVPFPAYAEIQPIVVEAREGSQEHLALTVRASDGSTIPAQGGVQIIDFSAELGADGIEVHVCGIPYPLYEELFPGAYGDYVAKLRER